MDMGYRAELAGDHETALNQYSTALSENPLSVEAWVAQLWMLLYLKEPFEADLWADRALAAFPGQPDLMAVKSLALMRCGLIAEAGEQNDAALAGSRDSANIWLARGSLQIAVDRQAASACFKHALAASADRRQTQLRIGDLCLFHHKYADAEAYLREATLALPESAWAWYGYGLAQRALGRDEAAKAALAKAAQLAPNDSRYHAALSGNVGGIGRLWRWLKQKIFSE
jgi:tetratricopeptide (TPR) repeat protein